MRIGKSLARIRKPDVVGMCATVSLLALALTWSTIRVRSFANVRKSYQPSDVWVVDRNGYPLESIRTRSEKRSLDWVEWSDISPAFHDLLVRAEDRRFYSHPGVDLLALSKATWERVTGRSQRGASTLTMQLVGLINDSKVSHRRNLWQKANQMATALKINAHWSKKEVLEAYVNLVSFRGELIGLRAASLGYFGKNPSTGAGGSRTPNCSVTFTQFRGRISGKTCLPDSRHNRLPVNAESCPANFFQGLSIVKTTRANSCIVKTFYRKWIK
ncbi:MAG: transglycosylase domain-containing protein [Bdellovibrionales bacterium]|nr:transglycosylase domain-containing protein [Bdellovibrionales bacterium]